MSARHYVAFGPYEHPQTAPDNARAAWVQLVEQPEGFFHNRSLSHWVDTAGVTPERALLNDLIATMEAIARLYDKGDLTDEEDALTSKLEDRRTALENALQRAVSEKLGLDYAVLWHAITPSGPVPKLP